MLAQTKPVKITVLLGVEILSVTAHIRQETQLFADTSAIVAGKAFCDSTNTFYYNLRKDESTIDLALNISMKGMSNESTAEVLRIQPATLKRWLALAAKQCDKVNATLMKNLNVSRIEMDELWVIVKKSSSKNGNL